ncbi:MAG: D-glycero-beta-D-manno-heptose 1-phosphate adenylyltransferase [Deltaproteobacteria bacterium]|nr:D-glycero-beta-D-manno-heptose 1-phosphate adenylyltransferase [Deltaproteobacteria bacterium]
MAENQEFTRERLLPLLAEERRRGRKIVFTNGCFDLLHPGHAGYLGAARKLGDLLVVGLNSDASIRRLKGEKRPIMPERARAELLLALKAVDYVIIFAEDDPYALIECLRPEVLVKGGDWALDQIIGADLVRERGGEVCSLPLVEDFSTTSIIEKILRLYA